MFETRLLPQIVPKCPSFYELKQGVGNMVDREVGGDFLRAQTIIDFAAELGAYLLAIGGK